MLTKIANDSFVTLDHILHHTEAKIKANDTATENHVLLGELQQHFNDTVSTSKRIFPASKGELQQQANKIDEQNIKIDEQDIVISQLVKQVNVLTPVSSIASGL